MRRILLFLVAVICVLLVSPPVFSQLPPHICTDTNTWCWATATRPANPAAGTFGFNTNTNMLEVWNGTVWVNIANNSVIDVMAFGAKCDNATNDAPAINNALAAAAAISQGSQFLFSIGAVSVQFPPNQRCLITQPLNMTGNRTTSTPALKGFIAQGVVIRDAFIACAMVGGTCFDALGAYGLTFENINIQGSNAQEPQYGIVVGRIDGNGADQIRFRNVVIRGFFTGAPYYNFASETTNWDGFDITQNDVNGYSVILDGLNKWGITSTFQTETLATNTQQSFQQHYFGPGEIAGGKGVWIGGAGTPRFNNTYANSAVNCVITLWFQFNITAFNMEGGIFDMHLEPTPTDYFCIDGTALSPQIKNFRYATENAVLATNSIFKITGSATSVTLFGLDLQVSNSSSNTTTLKIFDDPTKWTISGNVKLGSNTALAAASWWNAPASFSGTLCLAGICDVYPTISLVSALPTCVAALKGVSRFVTNNATASAYLGAVTNGGALQQNVICDGTSWKQD